MSQKRRPVGELAIAGIILLIPIYALVEISTKFREAGVHTGGGDSNAALFPRITAWGLVVLVCIQIVGTLLGRIHSTGEIDDESDSSGSSGQSKMVLAVFLIFVTYLIALQFLGYYISTPLFLAGLLLLFGVKRPLIIVVFSTVVTVLMWAVFSEVLNMVLPVGRFGLYW